MWCCSTAAHLHRCLNRTHIGDVHVRYLCPKRSFGAYGAGSADNVRGGVCCRLQRLCAVPSSSSLGARRLWSPETGASLPSTATTTFSGSRRVACSTAVFTPGCATPLPIHPRPAKSKQSFEHKSTLAMATNILTWPPMCLWPFDI